MLLSSIEDKNIESELQKTKHCSRGSGTGSKAQCIEALLAILKCPSLVHYVLNWVVNAPPIGVEAQYFRTTSQDRVANLYMRSHTYQTVTSTCHFRLKRHSHTGSLEIGSFYVLHKGRYVLHRFRFVNVPMKLQVLENSIVHQRTKWLTHVLSKNVEFLRAGNQLQLGLEILYLNLCELAFSGGRAKFWFIDWG
jgi:hypothetical protein